MRGASSAWADLVILPPEGQPEQPTEFAIEFKYEPAHSRTDIPPSKFPVVEDWKKVVLDIDRVKRFVDKSLARGAMSLFIDEGGYYRKRDAPPGSRWEDWHTDGWTHPVSVLISEA